MGKERSIGHALVACLLLILPEVAAKTPPFHFGPRLVTTRAAIPIELSVAFPEDSAGPSLYPGGVGDVQINVTNPNPFTVTITALILPGDASFASGFSDIQLRQPKAGCGAATSGVTWTDSTTDQTVHTLSTPVTVGPRTATKSSLVLTLRDAAAMQSDSPEACAHSYFAMPSLVGVKASASSASPTNSPTSDRWTA